MNTVSILIAVLLAAAVLLAFISARKHGGGCSGCSGCASCGKSCPKRKHE